MFLGNLSSANEHKARKKGGSKKKSTDPEDAVDDVALRRLRVADKPILYKTDDEIPRAVLLDFLKTCNKMMLSSYNVEEIVDDSISKDQALNMAAVDFQRDVLENNFQIEKDFGCKYLSMIPMKHEGDSELTDAAREFMFAAMKSYCMAMKARQQKYRENPSLKPKSNAPFRKKDFLEFFEGCNALMALPETKEDLRLVFKQTGQPPGPRVIEMQRTVLSQMGYDPDHGVSCLNKVNETCPGDREVMGKMQLFAVCAEVSCMIATFNDEQKAAFFQQIPPMMHHFPHMFVMQQRMAQQQQMMAMQQQQLQQQSSSSARLNEIEALKQSGILGLLSSPEGRLQIQELAGKVQASKSKLTEEVESWTPERKSEFFNNISEHPLLVKLMESSNPLDKIKTFIDMSDTDIDQMITLMLVVSTDSELLAKQTSNTPAVDGIMTTLGSLMNFNKFGPGPNANKAAALPLRQPPPSSVGDDHDHSHSHAHGDHGSCSHPHHQIGKGQDVSSGGVSAIER